MKSLVNYEEIPISCQKIIMDADLNLKDRAIVWDNTTEDFGSKLSSNELRIYDEDLRNVTITPNNIVSGDGLFSKMQMDSSKISISTQEDDLDQYIEFYKDKITIKNENTDTGTILKEVSLKLDGGLDLVDQNITTTGTINTNVIHATTYENLPESG